MTRPWLGPWPGEADFLRCGLCGRYPWEKCFPAHTPADAIDLAQRLLRYDPDQRLTASQALAHPFFDGVDHLVAPR